MAARTARYGPPTARVGVRQRSWHPAPSATLMGAWMEQDSPRPGVERRLAAILAADVAGYSRLMGLDEEGTLQALKSHRKAIVDPTIAAHHGRVVKTTGD